MSPNLLCIIRKRAAALLSAPRGDARLRAPTSAASAAPRCSPPPGGWPAALQVAQSIFYELCVDESSPASELATLVLMVLVSNVTQMVGCLPRASPPRGTAADRFSADCEPSLRVPASQVFLAIPVGGGKGWANACLAGSIPPFLLLMLCDGPGAMRPATPALKPVSSKAAGTRPRRGSGHLFPHSSAELAAIY